MLSQLRGGEYLTNDRYRTPSESNAQDRATRKHGRGAVKVATHVAAAATYAPAPVLPSPTGGAHVPARWPAGRPPLGRVTLRRQVPEVE
jgi:hypothetical protein